MLPLLGDLVPRLVAAGDGVALLEDVPGEDLSDAPFEQLAAMVERWVGVQAHLADHLDPFVAAGVPDERGDGLLRSIEGLLARTDVRAALDRDELRRLDELVSRVPETIAAGADCGIPATLVHGDFHPGNWRGGGDGRLALIDWGDSYLGHPVFDQLSFLAAVARQGTADLREVRALFAGAWQRAVPGSDPVRAATLLEPVAALRAAGVYRMFLDNIEASEHCYHAHDTEDLIRRALTYPFSGE